jgi:hypothetical protein
MPNKPKMKVKPFVSGPTSPRREAPPQQRGLGATGIFPGSMMGTRNVPQDSVRVNPLLPGGFGPAENKPKKRPRFRLRRRKATE